MLDGERSLPLGGVRQRSVLAILLLNAGTVVSSDRRIDELWPRGRPDVAQTALQQHVSRLRKLLAPHDVLLTRSPGYVVELGPVRLDLQRFEALRTEGRRLLDEGQPAAAATALGEALGLWRGPLLADLEAEDFVRDAARALDESRLETLELSDDAQLALGRHRELVGELRALVRLHPLRERLRAQLMLALYRSGRQAEALDLYADTRRTLVEELGLEPGPELQRLQGAILAHDPALDLHRRCAGAPRRRRALAAGVVAAALAAAAVAALLLLGDESSGSARTPIDTAHAVALDAESGEVERRIAAGRTPAAIAASGGVVWMVDADARTVLRVEPSSRVVETFSTGRTPIDVAVGNGSVWVANGQSLPDAQVVGPVATSVARLDETTRAARAEVELPRTGGAVTNRAGGNLVVHAGAVWAVTPDFAVVRIDAGTGAITATSRAVRAAAVAAGPAGVWVLGLDGEVARLDEQTARTRFRTHIEASSVGSIGVGDAVWVTSPDGTLWRIGGARTSSVGAIRLPSGIADVAVGPKGVWVCQPRPRHGHAGRPGDG